MDDKTTNVPGPAPRAHTLALQGAANRVTRGLMRTPLLCRLVGSWLMTIYVVGRRTGRHYAVPVAYVRHNEFLVAGTQFGWGRNLRTGEPVQIRVKGKRRTADVQVFTDEAGVVENYAIMARGNRQFARFNEIGLDSAGEPNPTDLHLAWAAGARAFRFTLRDNVR
jgi:deazaflavin-dependent oxidoreductase (nitroreductase family)